MLHAGKLACLSCLMQETTQLAERMVVCSNSTQCLDLVHTLCGHLGMTTVRIDGSTDASKRQEIVDSFNTCNVGQVNSGHGYHWIA